MRGQVWVILMAFAASLPEPSTAPSSHDKRFWRSIVTQVTTRDPRTRRSLEGGYGLGFVIQGRPLKDTPFHGGGGWLTVSPGYFEVFKIAMKRGRSFTDRDESGAPPVVIINEAFARQYFKDGDPFNERLVIGHEMREFMTEPPRQIIGVASDVRDGGLNSEPQPAMHVPQAQIPDAANALNVRITPIAWVVRTRMAPYAVSAAVQEQLRQVSGLPVSDIRSMTTW